MGLKKGDIDNNPAQENLKRISANFELELLRLIKTLNLISQSKELYRNQITYVQALTDRYKLRLSDFTIRLLDAERSSRADSVNGASGNPFDPPRGQAVSPDLVLGVVEDIRIYLKEISDDIEKHKSEYLNKLDSIYSVYNVELGASQTDLDLKLRELQKELARVSEPAAAEAAGEPSGIEVVHIEPAVSEEKPNPVRTSTPRVDYIGPDPTVDNITTVAPVKTESEKRAPEKKDAKSAFPGQAVAGQFKNAHVVTAGLIIMGIILGVIFYDALMRTWGIQSYSGTGGTEQAVDAPAPAAPDTAVIQAAPEAPAGDIKDTKAPAAEVAQTKPEAEIKEPEPGKETSSLTAPADNSAAQAPAPGVNTSTGQTEAPGSRAPLPDTYSVIGPGANVRSGPGMGFDVVTQLRGGEEFTVTGERQGRWVKVSAPDGKEGWISSKLIRQAN